MEDSLLDLVAAKTQAQTSQISQRFFTKPAEAYTLKHAEKGLAGAWAIATTQREKQSSQTSQLTSDARGLPMASAGAITAERSASLGNTT